MCMDNGLRSMSDGTALPNGMNMQNGMSSVVPVLDTINNDMSNGLYLYNHLDDDNLQHEHLLEHERELVKLLTRDNS